MKKIIYIALTLLGSTTINAQQLSVPLTVQQQDQWCWSGVSTCILNYYNFPVTQCQVADYARTASPVINFGTTNCCINALMGCNQPNYNWGYDGSISDILIHFGNVQNSHDGQLLLSQITNNVAHNHLMVYHWQWYAGGGHFVVGTGVNGNNVYYMNPWPGEGYKMSTYNNLCDDGDHYYGYTNSVLSPTSVNTVATAFNGEAVYPNPSTGGVYVRNASELKVYNSVGALAFSSNVTPSDKGDYVDLSNLAKGIYFVSLGNGKDTQFTKLVLQ